MAKKNRKKKRKSMGLKRVSKYYLLTLLSRAQASISNYKGPPPTSYPVIFRDYPWHGLSRNITDHHRICDDP